MRLQHNVKLTGLGRKDFPPDKNWHGKYKNMPINNKLKVGYSFVADDYEYGRTICVKNACRVMAKKNGLNYKFSVRAWFNSKGERKIRVWRIA
jgi:hypothetical protein